MKWGSSEPKSHDKMAGIYRTLNTLHVCLVGIRTANPLFTVVAALWEGAAEGLQ